MQNILKKIFKVIFILPLIMSLNANGEVFDVQIKKADSLYSAENYVGALENYENIISNEKKIPLSALLKCAKIYEGLNDPAKALCYLTWYKSFVMDNSVDSKIVALSEEHNLSGYNFTDISILKYFITKYRLLVVVTFSIIALLLLGIQVLNKRKTLSFSIAILILTIFTIGFIYFTKPNSSAIVVNGNSILHDFPSAGGNKVAILKAGHQVTILGSQDIWYKVNYDDQIGWIRKNNLWQSNL